MLRYSRQICIHINPEFFSHAHLKLMKSQYLPRNRNDDILLWILLLFFNLPFSFKEKFEEKTRIPIFEGNVETYLVVNSLPQ